MCSLILFSLSLSLSLSLVLPPSSNPLTLQFSDMLLHTEPAGTDVYKFKNEMPIFMMKVCKLLVENFLCRLFGHLAPMGAYLLHR